MIDAGHFDAYTVTTRSGPHVTLQAGVVHLGRHWTTTTRESVKAASIRRVGRATATIGEDRCWRIIGGEASVLDPAHLSSFTSDPFASAFAGGAMLRLALGRLDQLLGYAEAGTSVPVSFLPTGRVVLVTRIRDDLVLDGDQVVTATGQWARDRADVQPVAWRSRKWKPQRTLADVPDEIAALAWRAGRAWVGLESIGGAVALPADWEPTSGRLRVGRDALTAVAAELPGPVCVTLHDSGNRRPDEKLGVMLRGNGAVIDADDAAASVALEIQRVTYWCGFATTTSGRAA